MQNNIQVSAEQVVNQILTNAGNEKIAVERERANLQVVNQTLQQQLAQTQAQLKSANEQIASLQGGQPSAETETSEQKDEE